MPDNKLLCISSTSANSITLAVNPVATSITSASTTSAASRPHTAVFDAPLEYDSYIETREGNQRSTLAAVTEQEIKTRQSYHSLRKCLCCCFNKPWKHNHINCAVWKKRKESSEKCQTTQYILNGEDRSSLTQKELYKAQKRRSKLNAFRSAFWTLIVMLSVVSGGFFLNNNTSEFLNATVQTTLDGSVPLSEVFFPSVVVCNINQIRKSFFAELGFYENDTLVRIMYEDFIKGTIETERASRNGNGANDDPKRAAFYEVT